jgi:mersacidin/lichenicidin family type 2 lantibiotic
MSHLKTIRAWKDEDFRLSLSNAERASLPQNPAGPIELSDAELGAVGGGIMKSLFLCTHACVPTANCTPGPYCPF